MAGSHSGGAGGWEADMRAYQEQTAAADDEIGKLMETVLGCEEPADVVPARMAFYCARLADASK